MGAKSRVKKTYIRLIYVVSTARKKFLCLGIITNLQHRKPRGEIFFSSVTNLMNEVLINIMALINGERD